MEKLIFIMSICSFLLGLWFLVATWTGGSVYIKAFYRLLGFTGVLTATLYWLKLLNII